MGELSKLVGTLTPVKKGDDVLSVASSARMNAIQDILKALVKGDNIQGGENIRIFSQDGIIIISGAKGGTTIGGGGSTARQPYKITDASDDEGLKLKVEIDSWLMLNEEANSKITITGLGASFTADTTDIVYLKVAFDESEAITGASVEHGPLSDWDEYPRPYKMNTGVTPNKQQFAYQLLGYFQPTPDPNTYPANFITGVSDENPAGFQMVQVCFNNLRMQRMCSTTGGNTVLVCVPWHAPCLLEA